MKQTKLYVNRLDSKRIYVMLLSVVCAFGCAVAQSEVADTIQGRELNEIVVAAPRVVRKADMDIYHPSKSAVENSKNGMELLRNLMIPSLNVNDALGAVTSAGTAVEVRINGRVATIDQVRSLLPETIKRVEWIDNPGLRYKGASYVLNFIVANPSLGGSLMLQAQPALNQKFGYYYADVKLNSGRSQWEVGSYFKLTEDIKAHREYKETFTFPDGNTLTRVETPLSGDVDGTMGAEWASYSYIKPDTTVFYASIRADHTYSNGLLYRGLLSMSNGSDDILLTNDKSAKGITPSASAYLEQHFGRHHTLVVDFSASHYSGHSASLYQERLPDASDFLTDVNTYITDSNQAYGLETNYILSVGKSRFTAGASYTANRNRSAYRNLGGEVFHQSQDKVYFFAEYFRQINKFTVTGGLGAQYTSFNFRETSQGSNSWNLRPQATLTYSINYNHNLRLSFTSWQSAPSLAETNIAPQQLDGFQWQIGNASLKTSSSYMLTLRYGHNFPRVSGAFNVRAFTSPNAITPYLYWDSDRLITTYENSRGLQNLTFSLSEQIQIIPDWLLFSGTIRYRAEKMSGTGYRFYNHCWSGDAALMLSHSGFNLVFQYVRAQRDLWGEKISWGEDITVIEGTYNIKNWQFGAAIIMPFGKYDQGSKSLSRWNRNEQHMRLDMRVPYIKISYNLQWGRQKRGANKLINASADADKSSIGSR